MGLNYMPGEYSHVINEILINNQEFFKDVCSEEINKFNSLINKVEYVFKDDIIDSFNGIIRLKLCTNISGWTGAPTDAILEELEDICLLNYLGVGTLS